MFLIFFYFIYLLALSSIAINVFRNTFLYIAFKKICALGFSYTFFYNQIKQIIIWNEKKFYLADNNKLDVIKSIFKVK